jgi:hypothetical protein
MISTIQVFRFQFKYWTIPISPRELPSVSVPSSPSPRELSSVFVPPSPSYRELNSWKLEYLNWIAGYLNSWIVEVIVEYLNSSFKFNMYGKTRKSCFDWSIFFYMKWTTFLWLACLVHFTRPFQLRNSTIKLLERHNYSCFVKRVSIRNLLRCSNGWPCINWCMNHVLHCSVKVFSISMQIYSYSW